MVFVLFVLLFKFIIQSYANATFCDFFYFSDDGDFFYGTFSCEHYETNDVCAQRMSEHN